MHVLLTYLLSLGTEENLSHCVWGMWRALACPVRMRRIRIRAVERLIFLIALIALLIILIAR